MFGLRTLRLQLRFLVPLVVTLVAAAWLAVPLLDRLTLRWAARDLTSRSRVVGTALSDSVAEAITAERTARLRSLFNRTVQDERMLGIGLCARGQLLVASNAFPAEIDCAAARRAAALPEPEIRIAGGSVHVSVQPVVDDADQVAELVLLQDLSFFERRSQDTRRYLIALIAGLGGVMALVTVVVAQISWRGWVKGMQALLRGEGLVKPMSGMGASAAELAPLAGDLRQRLRDLEDDFRRSLGPEREWNAERLRSLLRTQLRGDEVIVVSNREPYMHEATENGLVVRRPASGLVTAVEPVMRACSGTWVAHGSGSGDREASDGNSRIKVPPGRNDYTLRRIWLSEEEEKGYYYGFANEGLWPLCHVAHVRPVFRESDWQYYREINERFAEAVVAEARSEDPVVLVQDYHFALLPALIRRRLPDATIISFWHIPWPNPESFGICPWRKEILEGMLGATILGFHTRFHCKNFMETVDRYLEARIEQEHSIVSFRDDETLVASYPISIEWPSAETMQSWPGVEACRRNVRERLGLAPDHKIAVGVDRFDYTKGILERFYAVERLLEKHPEWHGKFSFVQVAAPSRSTLPEYRLFQQRIHGETMRINGRFGSARWEPIRLLAEHHDVEAVNELYRAADVCVVTSLHDGMNLVCKEFVAARDDLSGVLILSRFAGAARELSEALIVNPYHVEETADALQRALTMPEGERRERMASLRMTVREANVFRWAGQMLTDAGRWRLRRRIEARVEAFRDT